MSIEQTALSRVEPNIIQVESLGIGLYRTNDTLNLASNQYVVVGEGTVGNNPSLVQHNVIIDNTGMAINASLTERDTAPNRGYALYIKGDVLVEGSIRGNQFTSNPASNINGDRFWSAVSYNVNNNIYSTNQVNLSTELQARSNTHKFNVVATPNRDIQRAHLSLQNTELAQFRAGILGNAAVSPVVFNTTSNVPIEFHVGRDRTYFSNVYSEAVYGNPGNTIDRNTPLYSNADMAPHMVIDAIGRVGIRTASSAAFPFQKTYGVRSGSDGPYTYFTSNVADNMGLYVNAPMYATDVLIYDAFSRTACNIDSLYVRSVGQSLDPSQIRPGTFSHGEYVFTSNVRMTLETPGPIETAATALSVAGNVRLACNLTVAGHLYADGGATLSNAELLGRTTAVAVDVSQTLTASNTLRFGSFLQTLGGDGAWSNVAFSLAGASNSVIEEIGGNAFVRSRMAVGLNLSNAEEAGAVFHQQFHVEKTAANRYELELWDRTLQPWNRKVAVLGHASADAGKIYKDASFVIATGTPTEDYYNGVKIFQSLPELPQNIYFYPGQYEYGNVYRPLIREDNPPVLGVFYNHRVGVGTYAPVEALHVEGGVYARDGVFIPHPSIAGQRAPLAKFYQNNSIGRIGIPSVFAGAEYINPAAPRVGINTTAQYDYGLVVSGGMKLVDSGLYTPSGSLVGFWLQGGTVGVGANATSVVYTNQNVGVGVSSTVYPLEIYSASTAVPTYLNIQANQVEVEAALNYSKGGVRMNALNQTWVMEAGVPYANRQYVKQSFAAYDTRSLGSNVLLAGQYFVGEGRHQVYIGDIYDAGDYGPSNSTYDDALIVGGNTTVFGSLKITSNLDVDGVFHLRGTTVNITGGTTATPVPLAANPNDVLITGSLVHLLPRATAPDSTFASPTQVDAGREAYVSIGYTQDTDATLAQKSDYSTYPILRVHQYINSLTIGRFSSTRPYALFDLETGRIGADASARMRYGLDYSEGTPALVFIDRSVPSQPKYFIKSQKQLNNTINTGFNLPYTNEPVANIHIYNGDTGENMLRVNYVSTIDSATYAPTFQMHRDNTSTGASYQWEMRGPRPDTLQPTEQKLSVGYKYDRVGDPTVNREVLTLLSGGKVGINQSSPYYALDLRCTESHHAIRLYSPTDSSTGMLLFQSGPSNTFGGDAVNDYRMYASNNGFYLDQQSTTAGLVRVVQIDSNANLGIRTAPNSNYTVNVGGYLNVSDGILINGFPFLYRQTTSNIITGGIRVDDIGNIFINPVSFNDLNEPGLVIGAGVASSNLLHVYSGCNANLMVLDSIYDEAQVHYRTRHATTGSNSTYRLFASNERFQLEYNGTHSATTKITGAHTGYVPLVSWDALAAPANLATSNMARMTLRGDLVFETACNTGAVMFQSGAMVLGASNGDIGLMPGGGVGTGRIGIGTTAARARMEVYGNTSNGVPLAQWTQRGDAPVAVFGTQSLVVSATGNVGIGTSTAVAKLHVEDVVYSRGLLPLAGGVGMTVGSNGLPWESGYFSSNLQLNDTVFASAAGSGTLRIESRMTGLTTPRVQFREWRVGEVNGGGVSLHVVAAEGSNLAFVNSNLGGGTEVGRVIPLVYSPTTRRVGIRSDAPTAVFQVVAGAAETVPAMEIIGNACNVVRALGSNGVIGLEVSGTGTVGIGTGASSAAGLQVFHAAAGAGTTGLTVSQWGTGDVLRLDTSVSNVMTVLNSGRVGFGTTVPNGTARVHIEGDVYASGTLTASNLNVINLNTTDVEITFSEQVSITNTGTDTALKVVQTGNAPLVQLQYGAMEDPKITAVSITSNGWVGIGTVAPAATLHVADSILYKTDYANTGALPAATGFPGMVAAVSAGAGAYTPYFAAGASGWSALAFYQDVVNAAAATLAAALASNNDTAAATLAAALASNNDTAAATLAAALASNNDQKGLKYTMEAVAFSPSSNIVVSGDGIFGANSNMPELNLYRGFTYRFSNVSPETVSLTSNTGAAFVGIDLEIVHDNATSNASPLDKYKIRTGEQARLTVPMNAAVGSNYHYELELDSNVYGVMNIV